MATNGAPTPDPLHLLRACITTNTPPIPTTSADATNNTDAAPLSSATHLLFNSTSPATGSTHTALALTTPTRFVSAAAGGKPVDLLSVYFCHLSREKGVGEYIGATQALNAERSQNGLGPVTNLVFVEKLDLVNWLQGLENESEFIVAGEEGESGAEGRMEVEKAVGLARGDGDVVMGDAGAGDGEAERGRLREILRGERGLGDRNSVLRGVKPTDFSHVRKHAELFLRRTSTRPSGPTPAHPTNNALTPALRSSTSSGKPTTGRRPEPIILLSPSASSLLRLSNIKSFLVDGIYSSPSSSTGLNILHISRLIPSIDATRPLRFILVEGPENFKPDYWSRVVAVFTTGQQWQFKGYKWQQPAELFAHALGIYVGWKGEKTPESVRGWGRGVMSVGLDAYREGQGRETRWRDREVVEEIWAGIEASMRAKGWGK